MQHSQAVLITIASVILGTGCQTTNVTLAPGADQVRLTKNPADMANCKPVGNIQVPGPRGLDVLGDPERQFRNRVVGLGGNAGLVTSTAAGLNDVPREGIGYRCP